VDAALRYRATYPDEIAARIELHRRETLAADPDVLIALPSRFSRRLAGIPALVAAIADITEKSATDCIIYLQAPSKG
jgi:hypothetical protein